MFRTLTTTRTVFIRVFAAASLAGGFSGLTGCETTTNTGEQAAAPAQAPTAGRVAPPSRTSTASDGQGQRTVTGGFTIEHLKWKQLGYQWDWTGFPALTPGEDVALFSVYDDAVVVEGNRASIAVLEARSVRARWSERLTNPPTRVVGPARGGGARAPTGPAPPFPRR